MFVYSFFVLCTTEQKSVNNETTNELLGWMFKVKTRGFVKVKFTLTRKKHLE